MSYELGVINFDNYHAICLDIEMPWKICHKFAYAYEMQFIWHCNKLEKLINCCSKGEK